MFQSLGVLKELYCGGGWSFGFIITFLILKLVTCSLK